ncbi:MAG: leucine-rich repeat domain-containing protein [Treponemataceae bacterium]|nr:leucine-rich repeat domain-containing protein [Treponemataceae bacterium]
MTTIAPGALTGTEGLKEITYTGRKAQWEKLVAGNGIGQDFVGKTVHCADGDWYGLAQGTGEEKPPKPGDSMCSHDFEYVTIDNVYHEKGCNLCDSATVIENHKYVSGTCACGSKLEIERGTIDENGVLTKYEYDSGRDHGKVTIPEGITGIGEGAFEGCSDLNSVGIPGTVTSIGDNAFKGCSNLNPVEIPNTVKCIGNNAFENCQALNKIELLDGVTSIGNGAFKGCNNLQTVTLPNTVTAIGDNAFEDCRVLEKIDIPESVTSIGSDAFKGCDNLGAVIYHGTEDEWIALSKISGIGENVTVTCLGE